jgi:hypothetical protein
LRGRGGQRREESGEQRAAEDGGAKAGESLELVGGSELAGRLWMYVALKTWEIGVGNLFIYNTAVLPDWD